MNRTSHTTDLFTLIGMMATIAGIMLCLFFLFTPVTFGAMETNDVMERSPDLQISMRWIQPILGQAIVEDALIRHSPDSGSIQWVVGRVIVELNRSRIVGGEADNRRIVAIARHAAEQFQQRANIQDRIAAPAVLAF